MSLTRALDDLANEAPDYSNADSAVKAARRRSRMVIGSAGAAMLAVVLAVLVVVPGFSRVPTRIEVPASASPLPTTHGVGAASFLYAPCRFPDSGSPCPTYLVLPDGQHYTVATPAGPAQASLSPNGQWLVYPTSGELRVRDLMGTTEFTYRGDSRTPRPLAWSDDSTRLAVSVDTKGQLLIELPSGRSSYVPTSRRTFLFMNSGELIQLVVATVAGTPHFVRIDPLTGAETFLYDVPDLPSTTTEYPSAPLLSPCACAAQVPVWSVAGGGNRVVAIYGVDLADGRVWGHVNLPPSAASPDTGDGVWLPKASGNGGIWLVHSYRDGTDIVQLNDVNGELTVVTRLPADSIVGVRGSLGN